MALKGIQVTLVTSTPTPLLVQGTGAGQLKNVAGNIQDPLPLIIQNLDAAITVWIGGPDVSATLGIELLPGASIPMSLYGTSEIPYAFAVGTPVIAILAGRQ
jgi:hypothetical protein